MNRIITFYCLFLVLSSCAGSKESQTAPIFFQESSIDNDTLVPVLKPIDKVLTTKSFRQLKSSMDSIIALLDKKNQQYNLDLQILERELALSSTQVDSQSVIQRMEIKRSMSFKLLDEKRKAIDHQLDLIYNEKSYTKGKAVANYLLENYNKRVEISFDQSQLTSNDIFRFEGQQDFLERYDRPCDIVYNDMDFQLKKHRTQTSSLLFFSYTNPKLKSFFKERDFLNAWASVIKIDDDYFLRFDINIASKNAKESYGMIEKSATLMITLIDGSKVYAPSATPVFGNYDSESKITHYHVDYILKKDARKRLMKNDIDKIGMFWSSGFEEYQVYNVDLVMNQLLCIEQTVR